MLDNEDTIFIVPCCHAHFPKRGEKPKTLIFKIDIGYSHGVMVKAMGHGKNIQHPLTKDSEFVHRYDAIFWTTAAILIVLHRVAKHEVFHHFFG